MHAIARLIVLAGTTGLIGFAVGFVAGGGGGSRATDPLAMEPGILGQGERDGAGYPGSGAGLGPGASSRSRLSPDLDQRLLGIEAKLAGLVRALEGGVLERSAEPVALGATAGSAGRDIEALVMAIQEASIRSEQKRQAEMSHGQLRRHCMMLAERGDLAQAKRIMASLQNRVSDPEERLDLLSEFAEHLREYDEPEDALRYYETALNLADSNSEQHAGLSLQVAWTRLDMEDPLGALRAAEAAAASSGAERWQRLWARFASGAAHREMGDAASARAVFTALVQELQGDEELEWIREESKDALERLSGG